MAAKHKATRRCSNEDCTYVVEVTDWELTYLFMLNETQKFSSGPYMEFLHLEIKGLIRQPEKFAAKEIGATFLGDREILPQENARPVSDAKPLCVGSITLRGERREFLGALPFDSLPIIESLLETKRIQYFDLNGVTPYRGRAEIRSVHFFKKYDPDEY